MEKYEIQGKIGKSGCFGEVFYGNHSDPEKKKIFGTLVLKRIICDSIPAANEVLEEFVLISKLSDDNILKYTDLVVEDFSEESISLLIVQEFANCGDVADLFKLLFQNNIYLEEKYIIKLMKQIASGLKVLHKNQIIHRDLKPENILIFKHEEMESKFADENRKKQPKEKLDIEKLSMDNLIFKIADFGLIKSMIGTTHAFETLGTAKFMAKEILRGKKYSYSVDVYALGCIMFQLLMHDPEFDVGKFCKDHLTSKKTSPVEELKQKLYGIQYYSKELKDLIIRCILDDPKKRISSEKLVSQLNYLEKKKSHHKKFKSFSDIKNFYENFKSITESNIKSN